MHKIWSFHRELWAGCLCDSGMAQRTEIKHFNMGVLGVVAKRLDAFVGPGIMLVFPLLPFWPYMKLLFCMWLVLPVFSGASYIYMNFVRKYVKFGGTVNGDYPEERKKVLQMLSLDARIAVNQYADKNGWSAVEKAIKAAEREVKKSY
ncbi:HVA22-like protein f isoform X4 [Populus trichocarpa]|uniref:HVA22-like protein f isoform X4 n=1 Tax=Populus trichocarpa TaxID=3694 RepID=UPI002277B559|nr:HVA22-like protein f isoform X4 [Populus trichocarpa]